MRMTQPMILLTGNMQACVPGSMASLLNLAVQMDSGKLAQARRLPASALHPAAAHEVATQMRGVRHPQAAQVCCQIVAHQHLACTMPTASIELTCNLIFCNFKVCHMYCRGHATNLWIMNVSAAKTMAKTICFPGHGMSACTSLLLKKSLSSMASA